MKKIEPKFLNEALIDAETAEETKNLLAVGAKIYPDGYNKNYLYGYKFTALMVAKTPEQTEILIKAAEKEVGGKKAYVNATSITGFTALMFAAANAAAVEQTRLLLEAGAKVNIRNEKDGWTALMHAKTADQTRLLIEYGAKVNYANYKGETALMKVVINTKNTEQTELLLKASANVNAQADNGLTPLMLADTAEQTKLLLDAGAYANVKDNFGRIALMYARSVNQTRLLLEAGAKAKVNLMNDLGFVALDLATIPEQQQMLLDAGAIPNTYTNKLQLYWINYWYEK